MNVRDEVIQNVKNAKRKLSGVTAIFGKREKSPLVSGNGTIFDEKRKE